MLSDGPPVLAGRAAIVTGGSRGLGLAVAERFVDAGASVMICARDRAATEAAAAGLLARATGGQRILWQVADVTDEGAVKEMVARAVTGFGTVHALVNNAGVYGPFGTIDEADWAEWARALAINVVGSVLPMRAILPHMRARGYGKIIQLSGGGATNPLPRISAYAASKAAIVRLAETVAEECKGQGIDVNSVAPGALNTRLLDEVLAAGAGRVGAAFFARALRQKEEGGAPLSLGADLIVFLASAASDGITGRLISAVWDNWQDWPQHLGELEKSDAYTLRRIAGRDRGMPWGDK